MKSLHEQIVEAMNQIYNGRRAADVASDIEAIVKERENKWISVKERLPEEGQIVDVWQMPRTDDQQNAKGLQGKGIFSDSNYIGWRSANYKYSHVKEENGEEYNSFEKCNERYLSIRNGRYQYKQLIVENGEVTHWQPLPPPPAN